MIRSLVNFGSRRIESSELGFSSADRLVVVVEECVPGRVPKGVVGHSIVDGDTVNGRRWDGAFVFVLVGITKHVTTRVQKEM